MSKTDDPLNKFRHIRQTKVEQLAWRLGEGEFVYADELIEVLRQEPPEGWPEALLEHVCELLDGSIRPKPGPRPKRNTKLENSYYKMIYSAMKRWDDDDNGFPEEFISFAQEHSKDIDRTLPCHERAARLTSIFIYGHQGHHATILNRISSRK